MKRTIASAGVAAALALVAAAPASAGSCRTVKCFNKQVARLNADMTELANALNCLQPFAVSRYPGYDYNGFAGATTALDFTESGDEVSTWVMAIPPGNCGAPHFRSGVTRRAFGTDPGPALDEAKRTAGGGR